MHVPVIGTAESLAWNWSVTTSHRPASDASGVPGQRRQRAHTPQERVRTLRAKATNDPFFLPSSATRRAQIRRRHDLVAFYIEACGGAAIGDLMLVSVRRAAELTVAAEMARAQLLNGQADPAIVVKLEGEARRAIRALGLKVDAKPPAPLLRERLAAELELEPLP